MHAWFNKHCLHRNAVLDLHLANVSYEVSNKPKFYPQMVPIHFTWICVSQERPMVCTCVIAMEWMLFMVTII